MFMSTYVYKMNMLVIVFSYIYNRTVILLVKILVEYCRYADSLPVLINEVMTKLIDIIKVKETWN